MEDWHFGFEFGGALDFRAKRGKLQGDPIPGEMTMPRFVVLLLLLVTVAVTTPIREARAMSSPAPPLAVYRVEALARIAVEQSVAGDTAGAVETIALALEVAEAIADEGDRSEALVHVVWAQAVTGDAAGAFATAEATTDDGDRMRALARAALVFLDAGAKADAVQAVTRLAGAVVNNSNPNGSDHLNMAVTAWLQAMTWDAIGALEAAEAIADNEVRAGTLLAVACGPGGDWRPRGRERPGCRDLGPSPGGGGGHPSNALGVGGPGGDWRPRGRERNHRPRPRSGSGHGKRGRSG